MDSGNNKTQTIDPNNNQEAVAPPFKSKLWRQIIAGIVCNLGGFAWGNLMSWSATALPKIQEDGSTNVGDVTEDMSSWIGSIATLGACVICIPASILLDKLGRRKTMMTFAPIDITGWLLIAFAQNIPMLLVGRFLTGVAGGSMSLVIPTYLAETTEPRIRGMLITGYDLMSSVGMLFSLVVGTYTSWIVTSLFCGAIPTTLFICLFFLPETPRFLVSKGKDDEASKSLIWLRGAASPSDVQPELNQIKESMGDHVTASWISGFGQLTTRPVRIALVLSFLLFVFQTGTAIAGIMFYTVDIFAAAGSFLDAYTSSIITGAVSIVASIITALVVDRFGRRLLLVASELFLAVSLGALSLYFHIDNVKGDNYASSTLGWLPLVALVVHLISFSIGIGPIPYSIMPEILPQRVRGLASSLIMTSKWGTTFLVTRFFNNLMTGLGRAGGFLVFSVICFVGTVYIFFFIPETKQKSLEEIQSLFQKKSNSNSKP